MCRTPGDNKVDHYMFTIYIGAYKPTVMYFGLTNSPATFQTMMNDLFRDLIN